MPVADEGTISIASDIDTIGIGAANATRISVKPRNAAAISIKPVDTR
jgi:hypothetical protein